MISTPLSLDLISNECSNLKSSFKMSLADLPRSLYFGGAMPVLTREYKSTNHPQQASSPLALARLHNCVLGVFPLPRRPMHSHMQSHSDPELPYRPPDPARFPEPRPRGAALRPLSRPMRPVLRSWWGGKGRDEGRERAMPTAADLAPSCGLPQPWRQQRGRGRAKRAQIMLISSPEEVRGSEPARRA